MSTPPLPVASRVTAADTTNAVDDNTPPADRWAALAYGIDQDQTNSYFGRAFSEASEQAALDTAIQACHDPSCEIKVYVEIGCIGVADGFESDNNREWYGWGATKFSDAEGATVSEQKQDTRTLAGETAIEGCGGGTLNQFCQVQQTFCTWDVDTSSPTDIEQWVQQMGGEASEGVHNTLLYFERAAMALLENGGLTQEQAVCVAGGQWATVTQVATQCQIAVDQLNTIYALANQYDN